MGTATLEKKYASLLGDDNFDILGQIIRQPNIFEILRITRYEIRHSNFLAWLLDPTGSHGLGNIFLTKFLKDAFLQTSSSKVSVAEVTALANGKVRIYREWNNIDILLEFSDLVLVIENKVWSDEHGDQLQRYRHIVERHFKTKRHFFVFLTPYGHEASMSGIYIDYSYRAILKNLESVLHINKTSMSDSSRLYITDYIKTIKLHFMGNSEANDLAKKLYYSHKDLFDFIIENRPDPIKDLERSFEHKVTSNGGVLSTCGGGFVRFLSKNLNNLIPRDGGNRGWLKKESFLFEIKLNFEEDKLRIYCTLPPDPCPSKPMLKKALDTAFGEMPDHQGWIAYYDKQAQYHPLDIAVEGTDGINAFVDSLWPTVETMIRKAEEALIPLLTKKEENVQLN